MCRVLSYLGKPVSVEEFLYRPDNSFIKQSYHPKYMSHLLNLAGFGMVAWDNRSPNAKLPFIYKTESLPFYDDNLRNLSSKISPSCLLAHLRGVSYTDKQVVSKQNVHPFIFPGTNLALAHNGSLFDFERMKFNLTEFVSSKYRKFIRGTTDSEWIYAMFLTALEEFGENYNLKDIISAIHSVFKNLDKVRKKLEIRVNSPVNLFITNGKFIAATRFTFDFGWQPTVEEVNPHFVFHSLWYTYGERYGLINNEFRMYESAKKSSIIISSEPLTEDTTTWIEVPEYTTIVVAESGEELSLVSKDIDL